MIHEVTWNTFPYVFIILYRTICTIIKLNIATLDFKTIKCESWVLSWLNCVKSKVTKCRCICLKKLQAPCGFSPKVLINLPVCLRLLFLYFVKGFSHHSFLSGGRTLNYFILCCLLRSNAIRDGKLRSVHLMLLFFLGLNGMPLYPARF